MIREILSVALCLGASACAQDVDGEHSGVDGGGDAGDGVEQPAADAGAPAAEECPRARISVMPGNRLNVRSMPNTTGEPIGSLANNMIVEVIEQVDGQDIEGDPTWLSIEAGLTSGYVSAQFASCTTDAAPVLQPPDAYRLPLECGTSTRITQGNNGGFSHGGRARYAFDFGIAINTPLVAMADGIVLYTFAETEPGEPCYTGGGSSCFPFANYVVLGHGDGSASIYKHLNQVLVTEGEFVPSGMAIGLSGSTGYSSGPHAHVMRQEECGAATSCQSVPLVFADVAGDGVPSTNATVTSGNCP